MNDSRILGVFDDYDSFVTTLRELKSAGMEDIVTFTPAAYHEVEEILAEKQSPIRYLTLLGGLLGFGFGAWLTVRCTEEYSMVVGGKPLISIPPYLIIAFELTILFSTLLTAIGYFTISPISRPKVGSTYDPSFSADRLGVSVGGSDTGMKESKAVMERNGAVETRLL